MSLGDISTMAIAVESSFGVLPGSPSWKAVELSDEGIESKLNYEDPETIKGNRLKSDNIQTRKEVSGDLSFILAPENGTAQFLKLAAGSATTYAGAFKRSKAVLTAGDTAVSLYSAAITSGTETVFINGVLAAKTADYTIDYGTGELTVVAPLTADGTIEYSVCRSIAGVYSHIFKSGSALSSFAYWNNKGLVEIFEYNGLKVDKLDIEITAENFFSGKLSVIGKDEAMGSEQTPADTFPVVTLSQLNPFLFKQAKVLVDWTADANMEKLGFSIENSLDPRFTINATDTVNKITPGKQTIPINLELEFDSMTYYDLFRNGTFKVIEIVVGDDNGVAIGTTGINYGLQFFFPRVRFETAKVPTKTGALVLTADGFANYDATRSSGFEIVLINSESSL